MNDGLRDQIRAALQAGIEPPSPDLADRAFGALAGGAVVAPTLGGALHTVGTWFARHWPWVGGGGAAAIVAAIAIASQVPAVGIYVAYADSRPAGAGQPAAFPTPWAGASGVDLLGSGPTWDAGAVRIDNRSSGEIVIDRVAVEIGAHHYELWGSGMRLGAHRSLILTQTQIVQPNPLLTNFDTSETLGDACSVRSPEVPIVHLVVNGHSLDFKDSQLVLTTGGRDLGNCPEKQTESHPWQELSRK
ncbi:MAG: hypothetical protein M3Z13_01870 [Candidatus Dormibacteraeota bacterium]|nr:hypothetical protein [Candidatus Dormibacteraeota bacterium]